jgi:hypothetical protein
VFGGLLDLTLGSTLQDELVVSLSVILFVGDPKFLMLACILTCSENSSTGLVSGRARDSICVLMFSLSF